MYYTKNSIKITARKYVDEDGTQYPHPHWFDGATDEQLTSLGITRHNDAIKPAYEATTQKLIILDSGEYSIVDLTLAELDARKVQSVSMRQARLALLGAGILGQVQPFIDSLLSPEKEAAQIEWEYAASVERTSPLVTGLVASLGLSDADLDNLFQTASEL
jgi:hypothetical protein